MASPGFSSALTKVQKPVSLLLREAGYARCGRTYNRTFGNGFVHVVNFQMGGARFGAGQFVVNLGVYLPCVSKVEGWPRPKRGSFYQDYHCRISERLGALANKGEDVWWDLRQPSGELGVLITDLMKKIGLPFLQEFRNYAGVLRYYDRHGTLPFQNEGRSAITAGIICYHIGRRKKAQEMFDRAVAFSEARRLPGGADYDRRIQRKCERLAAKNRR